MGITLVIILLVVGIIFFLIEIFLLPGFSIAGIVGGVFVGAAVFCAYAYIGATAGTITLIGSVILLGVAIWLFMRSRMLEKMSLNTDIDAKIEPLKGLDIKAGDKGRTMSRLAPMGKVRINGAVVEAKTNDDFIDQEEDVVVLQVYNTNVLVERAGSDQE